MTAQLPAPEWCKPGAPAYIRGHYGDLTPVTIDRLTRTQVVVRYRGTIERKFSLKRDLAEVGSDSWTVRRLISPEDPDVRDRLAKDGRRKVWQSAEDLAGDWIDTGDPEALEAAIRTLTESRTA